MTFGCEFCPKTFTAKYSKTQHVKAKHPEEFAEEHKCNKCNDNFNRAEDLERHVKDKHQAFYACSQCGVMRMTVAQVQAHNLTSH